MSNYRSFIGVDPWGVKNMSSKRILDRLRLLRPHRQSKSVDDEYRTLKRELLFRLYQLQEVDELTEAWNTPTESSYE